MVQSVESRIHKLLLEHEDKLKVADLLLKEWDDGNLAWVEQEAVGHYLIRCGFVRSFFELVSRNLKTGQKIPWSCFAEALGLCKVQLTKDDIDQLFVGAGEEQSLKDLVRCTLLDSFDGRFKKIRGSMDNTIMRAERTPPPHRIHRSENTTTTHNATSEYTAEVTNPLIAKIESRAQDHSTLKAQVRDAFVQALKAHPNQEKEAAIALGMMGAWQEGLEVLRRAQPNYSRSLLELEFLLRANHNVEALELTEKLSTQSPNLEQKSYIQFIQAQALMNLKKPSEALSVLENLISEDPDHSAARALKNQIRSQSHSRNK